MKFSVTIPAYKAKYLSEAIESVLSQTYNNFELIIVDDNSPENLKAIVDRFTDSRILYYRNLKNCGAINVVDNWNICLSYCKGDYVICMGDDDVLKQNCLEEYKKLINLYPQVEIFHALTEIIDENGKIKRMQESRPEIETVGSMLYHQFVYHRTQFIGDFCFSVKALRNVGGYYKLPLAYSSDWITANIIASNNCIVNSNIPMFQYRECNDTISRTQNMRLAAKSLMESVVWYTEFSNKIRIRYYNDIYAQLISESIIQKYYHKNIYFLIKNDVSKGQYWRLLYWIKKRKGYNIPMKIIFKSILNLLK